jgi:hypothetical protein
MGSHARPRYGIDGMKGRHRGEPEPLFEIDLGTAAVRTGTLLAAGATVLAAGAAGAGAATSQPSSGGGATPAQFAALRVCESSDHYGDDTGNGYYGAYQFDEQTWLGLGYGGYPYQASPATQDQAAERLQAARGWEPWPACSAKLGFDTTTPAPARTAIDVVARSTSATTRSATVQVRTAAPAFSGQTLTRALVGSSRSDVRVWQTRMAQRGWHLRVDGYFGPQSARIATQFAAEKHISAPAGEVTRAVWTGAWTAPITR